MPRNVPYPLQAVGLPSIIDVPIGFDVRIPFSVANQLGTVQTSLFAADDVIAATCWPGDDLAESFDPGVAWVSASAGTAAITLAASDTDDLSPGTYRLQIWAVVDAQRCLIHRGQLRLTSSPGSGEALPTYGSLNDMQRHYATIGDLQDPEADQAGFAEQRHLARKWFDTLIQRHYGGGDGLPTDTQFGNYDVLFGRTGGRSGWLQDLLDADALILNQDVIDCVSCHAIALVMGAQVGREKDSYYANLGARFAMRASNMASLIRAEIDTNDDGVGDIVVDLGLHDVIMG